MALGSRTMLVVGVVGVLGALGAMGCDATGGLLVINSKNHPEPDAGTTVLGPSVQDLVSAGTVAKSKSFKVVYTMGQSSQDQGVDKSKDHRLNGGLVGAMNGSTPPSADSP